MSKITRRNFIKTSALSAIFLSSVPQTVKSMASPFWDDYDEVICKKKFKLLIDGDVKSMSIGDAIGDATAMAKLTVIQAACIISAIGSPIMKIRASLRTLLQISAGFRTIRTSILCQPIPNHISSYQTAVSSMES